MPHIEKCQYVISTFSIIAEAGRHRPTKTESGQEAPCCRKITTTGGIKTALILEKRGSQNNAKQRQGRYRKQGRSKDEPGCKQAVAAILLRQDRGGTSGRHTGHQYADAFQQRVDGQKVKGTIQGQ